MVRKVIIQLSLMFCFSTFVFANNYIVSTKTDLVKKVSNAKPGDTITVANGTYDWGQISLNNTNGNSTSAWIVIKAESPSGVVFIGGTFLQFGGYRLMVTGFKFTNGNSGSDDVIQFRGGSGGISPYAYYSRLNNITIDNYNSDTTGCQQTPPASTNTLNRWVSFYGRHNRMDHCTFINKYNGGPTIAVMYDSSNYPVGGYSTYHLIDSNYFKGRGWQGGNEGETIRVGLGSMSNNDGYNIIEHNLFQYGNSTDPEIISNKSNLNTYRYNTFKDLDGGITMRQGRYNTVSGNFIIKTTPSKTRTAQYGIRLIDKGQRVFNNYIEGLNGNYGSLSTSNCPIILYSGQAPGERFTVPIPGYYSADSCIIAFNTIVNCYGGAGMVIGYNHPNKGVTAPFKPQGLTIANNIVSMAKGQAIIVDTSTTTPAIDPVNGISNTLPVSYFAEGNMYNATTFGSTNTTGFSSQKLTFGSRTNGILPPPSLVQGAAINSMNYNALLGGKDIFNNSRTSPFSVGAIEVNGTGSNINIPLDSTMVGAGTPIIPLPVSIVAFTGTSANGNVTLRWEVANEIGINNYEIELSNNASVFNRIGSLTALNQTVYNYTTQLGSTQNNYYRLKIVSKDGSVKYSNAILMSGTNEKVTIGLYPNPAKGKMTLSASHIKLNTQMSIVDFLGRIIRTENIQNGMNPVNVDGLHTGSYYISIIENGKVVSSVPFIVQQ